MTDFKPYGLATAIGSLPHQDPARAVDLILKNLEDIPFWPQLTRRSFLENMCVQYTEGLPCVRLDQGKERVYLDTTPGVEVGELERFYERYLANDTEYFRIGPDYAQGLHAFIDALKKRDGLNYIKGQVTGPITFGLTLKDQSGLATFHNKEIMDALTKGLEMKARWQIKTFMEFGARIIIFFDEPYLSAFGSAFVNIDRKEAIVRLNEVIGPAKEVGAITGIHCCGNTDWSILMETEVDIISFDAYGFMENISLYPEELKGFLNRGGILAWGIVPSSPEAMEEKTEGLAKRLREGRNLLGEGGNGYLVTPSCGCGSLSIEEAEKVLRLTHDVSCTLRDKRIGSSNFQVGR